MNMMTQNSFSSSLTPGRDLSQFGVVDSVRLINLTAFRSDFVTFEPPSGSSRVSGVGVDVHGRGTVGIAIPLVSGQIVRRTVHALYTLYRSYRSTQRIGRLLSVTWMQSHNGCDFVFPTDYDLGLLLVLTRMGVLKPSENGLYMLSHKTPPEGTPSMGHSAVVSSSVALTAHCALLRWHRRFGHAPKHA
jgi:hypothetical protein